MAPGFNVVSKPNDWSRSTRKATDTGFSETGAWQWRFWEAFHTTLDELDPSLRGNRTPRADSWIGYPIGRSEFRLHATVGKEKKQLRAGLLIEKESAKAFFDLLKREENTIEAEIGAPLDWQRLTHQKRSRIDLSLDNADPTDEEDWPRQHKWLAEKLNALHRVFSHRVGDLDPADWRGEDVEPED